MADPNMEAEDKEKWSRYFAATADKPVHQIFESLEAFLPASGTAIDLGCGAGRHTIWLLEHGMQVVAVDVAQEAIDYVRQKLPPDPPVETICSSFQDLELDTYDVAVAIYTLFFLNPQEFSEFWPRVVQSIRPSGLFAGQFLGVNDTWNDRGYTLHDRGQVEQLFDGGFKVLLLQEEDQDGETALGEQKHWHVFHVIARKL